MKLTQPQGNHMKNYKVIGIDCDKIIFDGVIMFSNHSPDGGGYDSDIHYLDLTVLNIKDFKDLEFDLNGEFFERIHGYGIALIPIKGHPVRIAGYGYQNGYYSDELTLVLTGEIEKTFDITKCQELR